MSIARSNSCQKRAGSPLTLLVQFTKATDAANRAVMADTDATSVEFAREAEQATQAVLRDVDALGPVLQGLKFADESRLLQQFVERYGNTASSIATSSIWRSRTRISRPSGFRSVLLRTRPPRVPTHLKPLCQRAA